jgi:hypothetical protein
MLSAQIPFRGADESDLLRAIRDYKVREKGQGGRRGEDREEIIGGIGVHEIMCWSYTIQSTSRHKT